MCHMIQFSVVFLESMASVTEIPKKWRMEVCEILDCYQDRVRVSVRANEAWEAMFPDSSIGGFSYQLFARMSEALKVDGIMGTKIPRIGKDTGEIWEFLFSVNDKNLYGKISLRLVNRNGRKEVYIYSAHPEERPYL